MSPRCVKCDKFFHPDFSVVVDDETNACKCVFCYTEKNEVTITDEESGRPSYNVTKDQAEKNYRRYINELKQSDRVANILTGDVSNKLK